MRYPFFPIIVVAGSLMVSCGQKQSANNSEIKPIGSAEMIIPVSPDTLLTSGRRNIFLVSRREMPGLFVERSFFPPGYKSNPHTHQGDLNITVISGSFNLALRGNPDSSAAARVYGPGSFVIIPANEIHFEWFTENTVMDITGIGPLNTINQPIIHSSSN
ncbi:MAG TPA: cupin domain-containing protein [Chitinophagaceae bacterium]|nr:cupin domain-containing protein [Chitinophagaceae bacterium]